MISDYKIAWEFKSISDFFSLAMRPSFDVRCYNRCIMGGLRFHMLQRDSWCITQNNGVMVIKGSSENNFYGVLDEVLNV